ncbi:unnamed protein product [Ectocarpus sp. 12 AP-2014]
MDYAEGGDLGDYLMKQNGRLLDEELTCDWFVQMTSALRYIHEKNILHIDLKPMNVFLTGSGTIKLGDFGIAKVLKCTADMARTRIGTLVYMAPEVMGVEPYGHKTDMWSLSEDSPRTSGADPGQVRYMPQVVGGGGNMSRWVRCHRTLLVYVESWPPDEKYRYSAELRGLVGELLQKDPHARPSTDTVLRRPLIWYKAQTRKLAPAEEARRMAEAIVEELRHDMAAQEKEAVRE